MNNYETKYEQLLDEIKEIDETIHSYKKLIKKVNIACLITVILSGIMPIPFLLYFTALVPKSYNLSAFMIRIGGLGLILGPLTIMGNIIMNVASSLINKNLNKKQIKLKKELATLKENKKIYKETNSNNLNKSNNNKKKYDISITKSSQKLKTQNKDNSKIMIVPPPKKVETPKKKNKTYEYNPNKDYGILMIAPPQKKVEKQKKEQPNTYKYDPNKDYGILMIAPPNKTSYTKKRTK
jgi:hypothetical protein